jgi:hypothetical protein
LQIKFHKIFYVEINFHKLATAFPIAAQQQKQFSNHQLSYHPAAADVAVWQAATASTMHLTTSSA